MSSVEALTRFSCVLLDVWESCWEQARLENQPSHHEGGASEVADQPNDSWIVKEGWDRVSDKPNGSLVVGFASIREF